MKPTIAQAEFAAHVANAYEHLHDLVYLRAHPLADLLLPPSLQDKGRARQLHTILLGAIDELDPGPQAPAFSHEWRRHRLMVMRYVQGLSPQAVADQLAVSLRHYYREHKTAIEAIADLLWPTCQPGPRAADSDAAQEEPTLVDRIELLRLEAARLSKSDRYARVGDVVRRVLGLVQEMLRQRGLAVQLALPDKLPGVSVDAGLLRQMLMGILGYLAEAASQAEFQLSAQVDRSAVRLSVRVEPPAAVHPLAQAQERLAGFAEMAALTGAAILPLHAGPTIVGFDLQLPMAQRTVLVVDDNEDVLELFRGYLSPQRYRVVTAQSGQAALDMARQMRPHAITLDLMMPDQDGWDLLQLLLNHPETSQIPLIVCSVLKQKELALSLGATAFLEKPVTKQALLSALEALE